MRDFIKKITEKIAANKVKSAVIGVAGVVALSGAGAAAYIGLSGNDDTSTEITASVAETTAVTTTAVTTTTTSATTATTTVTTTVTTTATTADVQQKQIDLLLEAYGKVAKSETVDVQGESVNATVKNCFIANFDDDNDLEMCVLFSEKLDPTWIYRVIDIDKDKAVTSDILTNTYTGMSSFALKKVKDSNRFHITIEYMTEGKQSLTSLYPESTELYYNAGDAAFGDDSSQYLFRIEGKECTGQECHDYINTLENVEFTEDEVVVYYNDGTSKAVDPPRNEAQNLTGNDLLNMSYNDFVELCSGYVEETYVNIEQDGIKGVMSELYPRFKAGYNINYNEQADNNSNFNIVNVEDGGYINNEIYVGMTYNELAEKADYLSGVADLGMTSNAHALIDGIWWGIHFKFDDPEKYREKFNRINDECENDYSYYEPVTIDVSEFNPKIDVAISYGSKLNISDNYYTDYPDNAYANVSDSLNLRISTDKDARVLTAIPAKAKFHLVRSYPNGWSYVKYIDSGMPYSGYVATEFVKTLE